MTKLVRRHLEQALRLLGADPATADALTRADALWLARVLPVSAEHGGEAEPADMPGSVAAPDVAPPEPPSETERGFAPSAVDPGTIDPARSGSDGKVSLFVQQTGADDEPQLHARRVPVPAAEALPGRAALERALRPFLRRRPSRVRCIVDAEATAEASAQDSAAALLAAAPGERAAPVLVPVLRPVPERWFDMVLLAEQDDTMRVFEDTLKELRQLLARHGAFRRVGLWRWSVRDGDVHVQTGACLPCAPRAMLQGQHPQLVWVLTHGASAKWNTPELRAFVRSLAAHAVVAVVQLLPETAWGATALGESRERVRSRERAATNRQLLKRDLWTSAWDREGAQGVVPMLSLEAGSVARWAEFVMAPRALEHAAVLVEDLPPKAPRLETGAAKDEASADPQAAIRDQVLRFKSIASPRAFALLRLLSGAWITLPVMRLLLQTLPGQQALTPIAEVLLSGLLRRTSKADARTEELSFDFATGVREWVSGSLSRDERRALDDVMADSKEAIRRFVETRLNRTLTSFGALLLDPDGAELLPASAKSFVEVSRKLRALRGTVPAVPPVSPAAAAPLRAPQVAETDAAEQAQARAVRKRRILLLSDLHIGREKPISAWRERPMMGKAWLENLWAIQATGRVDLVCVTGDVANTGLAEEYEEAEYFVRELMGALGLPMERFFCVPGNHDINRRVNASVLAKLRGSQFTPRLDPVLLSEALRRQDHFRGWMADLGRPLDDGALGYRAQVDLNLGAPLYIIGLDSAWMSGDDNDAGALRVTHEQLQGLLAPGMSPGWAIALMHHPLSMLSDSDYTQAQLSVAGVKLLLHGHDHYSSEARRSVTVDRVEAYSVGGLYPPKRMPAGVDVLDVMLHPAGTETPGRIQPTRFSSRVCSASGPWRDGSSIDLEVDVDLEPNQSTIDVLPRPEPPRSSHRVFVGRQRELDLMREALLPADGTPPRRVALTGGPGIGKTALTQQFLDRVWIPATRSGAPVEGSYLRIMLGGHFTGGDSAKALGETVAGHLGISDLPVSVPPAALWHLLRRELQRQPRLLLFDDVNTESLATALDDLARQLPGCPIVATSRSQAIGRDWVYVELAPLSLREACELLMAATGTDGDAPALKQAAAEELASVVGYLPLALHLAAQRWKDGATQEQIRSEFRERQPEATPDSPPAAEPNAVEKQLGQEDNAALQRELNEVKMVLVGRGSAGKTSIARRLVKNAFSPAQSETQGIDIVRWKLACADREVTVNTWDFAGQVVLHAIHQFFLSASSVYVLVLTGREDTQRADAEYWLKLIRAFATDAKGTVAPVIVALNKFDAHPFKVDQRGLKDRYPFITAFVETDCKSGRGIDELRARLAEAVAGMPLVRQAFRPAWWRIKQDLEAQQRKRNHLPYSDFQAMCARQGETDPTRQRFLADVFHELGVALNYGRDPRLRDETMLNPRWVTERIYKLLRTGVADDGSAVLDWADVVRVLPDEEDEMRRYLVGLMQRFDLAFPLSEAVDAWLVPQRLPSETPELGNFALGNWNECTRLRFNYPMIPEWLLPRFIARTYLLSESPDGGAPLPRWSNGVALQKGAARALVRVDMEERQINVVVSGEPATRPELLGVIRSELQTIHSDFKGLGESEWLEVVDGAYVPVETLRADERAGRLSSAVTPTGIIQIDPTATLNRMSPPQAHDVQMRRVRVFISYASADARQKDELLLRLKPLKEVHGLLDYWDERCIPLGGDWDHAVRAEVERADVVLLLVSSRFIASDYIRDVEIRRAVERAKGGQCIVVPIILEKVEWTVELFGNFNAIPRKGKPIKMYRPQSNGWFEVGRELRQLLERFRASTGRP